MLDTPGTWTQRAFARDVHFGPVSPEDPKACWWCLEGSIEAAAYQVLPLEEHDRHQRHVLFMDTKRMLTEMDGLEGVSGLIAWNDTEGRTHDEVIDFLDRAISQQGEMR